MGGSNHSHSACFRYVSGFVSPSDWVVLVLTAGGSSNPKADRLLSMDFDEALDKILEALRSSCPASVRALKTPPALGGGDSTHCTMGFGGCRL